MTAPPGWTRPARIVAQDPGVRVGGKVVMADVDIPNESLRPGPRGHRLHIIDYDSSNGTYYEPFDYEALAKKSPNPYASITIDRILGDPGFHAMNVYASAMRTLGGFEFSLGRKIAWNQPGHQLKIFPHAFRDANAFYAPDVEALLFGYFPGAENMVFSCLAHDVIAHETTHAVLDGLRPWFTDPSSRDQAAFHEGYADVIALLEVFSLREVVKEILRQDWGEEHRAKLSGKEYTKARKSARDIKTVSRHRVQAEHLINNELFGLAEELGGELSSSRGKPLRRSIDITPTTEWRKQDEWREPHRRGEILAAIMLRTFAKVWRAQVLRLDKAAGDTYDTGAVADEGAEVAAELVKTAMRALDYTPPIHLTFEDYLSALLTADFEIRPDQGKFHFRDHLLEAFAEFGVYPAEDADPASGTWRRQSDPPMSVESEPFDYGRLRFESMQRDRDEVFRFSWENRRRLGLLEDAYTTITSIRPAVRIAPVDGVAVRETVVECIQQVEISARELKAFGVTRPKPMPLDTTFTLRGGATMIFDDYGRVKYLVTNPLPSPDRKAPNASRTRQLHSDRLRHLWDAGYFVEDPDGSVAQRRGQRIRELHLRKALDDEVSSRELW